MMKLRLEGRKIGKKMSVYIVREKIGGASPLHSITETIAASHRY